MSISEVLPLFPSTLVAGRLEINNDILLDELTEKFSKNETYSEQDEFYKTKPNLNLNPTFKELTESINNFVNLVCSEIYQYTDIVPYITQMWAVGLPQNKNIHKHYHPNSVFSGVYYPQNLEYSALRVYTPHKKMLLPKKTQSNLFNSYSVPIRPKQGDIILFPSDLEHDTEKNNFNGIRISIAFNIFVKGEFGNESILSHLRI
jgi:uncharacterized protein (TIGR02466 family)